MNKKFLVAALAALTLTEIAVAAGPDPLDVMWTFGAHEPYTMYRRMGVRSTGGVNGNAYWLKDWFKWWDSEECPKLMESLGLNFCLSRFYKGMGWQEEVKDFANVRRFVENCHKHGVKAVAYIQFSTVYPEVMKKEIPNLEDWASKRADGGIYYYGEIYFRWEVCFNNPELEAYLKKMVRLALVDGGFDGVFFDNAYQRPCYCKRCQTLFHDDLMSIKDPAGRFGFDDLSGFGMPTYTGMPNPLFAGTEIPWGEVREPLLQQFNVWRTKRMTALFKRFYDYAHEVKPDAIVCANLCPFRAPFTAGMKSVDMMELPKCFDLIMGQVENSPNVHGDVIESRARDLKYAREFPGLTYFASCDGAAGDTPLDHENLYLLPMIEDLVFGGVPADRTIMAPRPESPEFVNHARLAARKPQLRQFLDFRAANRTVFAAPDYMPVRLVVSQPAMIHSEAAYRGLLATEEVAMRAQIPFGYSLSTEENPLPHADDAEVMVLANQTCLSDRQVAALVDYAKRGGKLVCIGETGVYDEWNRQRFSNALREATAGLKNVTWRDAADEAKDSHINHICYSVHAPKAGVAPLKGDFAAVGWKGLAEVVCAPETVFANFKTDKGEIASLHLVNYLFETPAEVTIRLPIGKRPQIDAPFEEISGAAVALGDGLWKLPAFCRYLLVKVLPDRSVAESPVDSGTTFAKDALQRFVDSGEIAGAISVLYRDGMQETACLGYADRETGRRITLDDLFMQCSQTKGFCGVTIAMLVEEGKISLDDPVSKYLPEFETLWVETALTNGCRVLTKARNALLVRHVMNHMGGFPFELENAEAMGGWSRRMPLRSVAATAAAMPLKFEPGSKVSYSNVGIDIGAAIVEVVSGCRWEDFLQKRVLDPLEMKDSGFWPRDEQLARRIELYQVAVGKQAKKVDEPNWMQRPFNDDRVFPSAGAGLWTTARDQLKFYKMLMNLGVGDNGIRILKSSTVKDLLARTTRPSNLEGYSLGLGAPKTDGENEWFGHGGAWNTSCMVNWHRRELSLWVVQFYGNQRWDMCKKERDEAADAFFKAKIDKSAADSYTGRLK